MFIAINKIKTDSKDPHITLNYNKSKNTAATRNWNELKSIQDPNAATDQLINKIKHCIEMAKTIKKEKNKGRKSWITKSIIKSSETKEFLYNLWQLDRYNEVTNIINFFMLKSGGVDKINAKTLKIICKYIAEPLSHIINTCIERATWSDALKKAEIVL